MTTAIVLAGGGAKGDFEVGALHFLYHHQGIRPDVITSTSVGSVNALKLAEGEGDPTQGLAGLTQLWLARDSESEFFADASWLAAPGLVEVARRFVRDLGAANPSHVEYGFAVNEVLRTLCNLEDEAAQARLAAMLPPHLENLNRLLWAEGGSLALIPAPIGVLAAGIGALVTVTNLIEYVEPILKASSFFSFEPLMNMARENMNLDKVRAWSASGKRLLMAAVALQAGVLRYVDQDGRLLERDLSPMMQAGSLAPPCQTLADTIVELEGRLADLQESLKTGGSGAGPGIRRIRAELVSARKALKQCRQNHPEHLEPVTVDLVLAMIASASIPAYLPPQKLGDDEYVDGGIRAVLPTEAAIRLGADRIFAIQCSKDAVDAAMPGRSMLTVALRALPELAINEIKRRDAHPPLPVGTELILIEPRVDTHTLFSLYPAFVRARMAYGWMCAADALTSFSDPQKAQRAREIADEISVLRYGAARLEAWLTNHPIPPRMVQISAPQDRQGVYQTLQDMKQQIAQLVTERGSIGALLPNGSGDWDSPGRWSFGYEVHPWNRQPFDDGSVTLQGVPSSMRAGESATAVVTLFNSGNTVWESAQGVRLGSTNPPDNMTWGINRIPLPYSVRPGESLDLSFAITAPAQAGAYSFEWQMVRDGVAWFGASSDAASIAVSAGAESPECNGIRADIQDLNLQIQTLSDRLGTSPQVDARLRRQIRELEAKRKVLADRGQALGCVL